MKKFFSLIAAVLFAGSMMAETVTLTIADYAATEFSASGISVTTAKNEGTTAPAYNATGKDLRVYAKGSITLSSAQNITGISFVISTQGKKRLAPLTASVGEIAVAGDPDFTAVWSGSATEVTITVGEKADYGTDGSAKAGQLDFTAIEVTLDGEVPPTPSVNYYVAGSMNGWAAAAAYMLTPNNESLYQGEFTFAANDEFKVIGFDGENTTWFPEGMGNNFAITEAGDYKITFNPAGNVEGWYAGFFNVVKKETPVVEALSLAEFIAAKPTEEVTLKDLTVIFANGKNTYVIDAEGIALVIYDANKTFYDGTLTAGTILSGQKATYQLYKNQDEIIPTNTAEISAGVAPVPTELDAKPTDANINHFVSFKNVAAVKAEDNKFYIFGDVQLYGATGSLKPTEDGNYDIEGLYILYNETTPEIIVTALQASGEQGIEEILSDGKTVKVVREGKLVILKGDHEFTPMGQIVK